MPCLELVITFILWLAIGECEGEASRSENVAFHQKSLIDWIGIGIDADFSLLRLFLQEVVGAFSQDTEMHTAEMGRIDR